MTMNSIEEIAGQLLKEQEWLLIGHSIPDGDCVGSLLGMAGGLASLGKEVRILLQDPIPHIYNYLQGMEMLVSLDQVKLGAGGILFLDCADRQRVGDSVDQWLGEQKLPTVNIDHHLGNNLFADYNYVDHTAAAAGEIVLQVLKALNVTITPPIAEALFAALIMDTGSFLNTNTTSRTLRFAAELMDNGVSLDRTRINLFESKTRKEILLTQRALRHLDFSDDGRIAWMLLPYQDLIEIGALDLHPEGLINYTRMIQGVEVGVLLREVKPGLIKIGLRSRGQVDVASLAAKFGGGGHRAAAGARLEGTLEEVRERVINKIKEVI
ncbi:MAG TPA: DHH family phosphoesterase [Syntrophomonadaceae bacterium]|nr:DHH family phosphoesterase [Syntrophomonadaceae bacterium]